MRLHHLSCVTTILLLSLLLALNSLTSDASAQAQTTDATNRVSTKDRKAETDRLFQQGVEQFRSGAFQAALQTYQQVLEMRKTLNDKAGVAETLDNIGEVYTGLSDYDKAMDVLQHVDLIVLSACQTARGGELGNGEEILGFGYQMQLTGAKATVASLWSVDDQGTQVLMDAFYATLQKGNISKAEALRQAQIALITNDYTNLGQQRTDSSLPATANSKFSNPYYWAPFILIGNGL